MTKSAPTRASPTRRWRSLLDPSLVRSGRLQAGAKLTAADGVYGDPRRASAELGKIGVDMIVARTVDAIRKAIAQR